MPVQVPMTCGLALTENRMPGASNGRTMHNVHDLQPGDQTCWTHELPRETVTFCTHEAVLASTGVRVYACVVVKDAPAAAEHLMLRRISCS